MQQQFSNGDRVSWHEDDKKRTGIVAASDVEGPADAGDKAGMRFYSVATADGTSYVLPENELEPTDSALDSK